MRFEDGWGIVTPTSDADFQGMCKALDVEGWDDPRVATMTQRRRAPRRHGADHGHGATRTRRTSRRREATERFEAQRVPFAMILSPDQLTRDEHAVAIGLFVEDDHHIVGKTRMPRHPTRFRGHAGRAHQPLTGARRAHRRDPRRARPRRRHHPPEGVRRRRANEPSRLRRSSAIYAPQVTQLGVGSVDGGVFVGHLAELVLEDLVEGAGRELVDEVDRARHLEVGEVARGTSR